MKENDRTTEAAAQREAVTVTDADIPQIAELERTSLYGVFFYDETERIYCEEEMEQEKMVEMVLVKVF